MSIYIPGMEMPKSCDECYFLGELGACDVLLAMNKKAEDRCPLIEVPPHGRLGDMDALRAENNLGTDCSKCKRDVRSCQFEMIHSTMDFCEWIDDAPTIIPADGADKEEPL